jgi:hypothetical protein
VQEPGRRRRRSLPSVCQGSRRPPGDQSAIPSRARSLADNPHLELKRLPAYSPQLNVSERLWKLLRRRATHNRLFDNLADLTGSIRNSLRYFQTMRGRIKTLLKGC